MLIIKKPSGIWIVHMCMLFVIMIIVHIIGIKIKVNIVILLLYEFVLGFISIRYLIATGRTIELDPNGCTVNFYGYRKFNQWENLKTKRIESARNTRILFLPYHLKCVVLCKKNICKKGIWRAEGYSIYIHPFSVVYIYLIPKEKLRKIKVDISEYLGYVVEEELFMEKIKKWNVEMDYSDYT